VPELPELQALAEGLDTALRGRVVAEATAWSPASLKTAEPAISELAGRSVTAVRRRGKLIIVEFGDLAVVTHLMQAGRLGLVAARKSTPRQPRAWSFGVTFAGGESLLLRELSTKRRATVHVIPTESLVRHPMIATLGPEPGDLDADGWKAALSTRPGVLQKALREGRRIAGIGRCYASEIMWAARLAPLARTDRLTDEQREHLRDAARVVLDGATARARARITTAMPDREKRITAVHGHYREPCLRCGTPLARIGFVEYELVYCPTCQTNGRTYADRRTSAFLR
jgi:formamidopyrimidine-DNA glycosylase